jgi:hypothetical protein
VSVNGQGSDEVWSSWRAGGRAVIDPLVHTELEGLHVFRGSLISAWGWRHERLFILAPDRALCVVDRVDRAPANARVLSHLHFDPGVQLDLGPDSAVARQDANVLRLSRILGASWSAHEGETAPWRGYSSFHMGEFTPSPEVEIDAVPRDGGFCTAWLLAFDEGVTAETLPGQVVLRLPGLSVTVATSASLRWELRKNE